jgi:hypothetical protein
MSGEEEVAPVKKKTTKKSKEKPAPKAEKPVEEKKEKVPKVPKERKPNQTRIKVEETWNKLVSLDHNTATRFIIIGMLLAIIFGSVAMVSKSLAANSADWRVIQEQQAKLDWYNGIITLQEYDIQISTIIKQEAQMNLQQSIFGVIAQLCVNLCLIIVLIGFVSYANDPELDKRIKQMSFLLGGIIIVVMMFTSLFTGITVAIF